MPGFAIDRPDGREWAPTRTRPEAGRTVVDLTSALGLGQSRARLWRYPPGTSGTRHLEHAQEEVFVVLGGTLTLLLGEPPEAHALPAGSIAAVQPETAMQVRNEGDGELTVLVYGAPPVAGAAEYLPEPGTGRAAPGT